MNGSSAEGVTAEELIAYADGEATPAVRDRVAATPALQAEAAAYDQTQQRLRGRLYRFDCPPPHTIGEYALALLPVVERTRIAAHLTQCPRCTDELRVLRTFLATEPLPAPRITERVRRLIAALIPTAAAPAVQLRGGVDPDARTYRAGDVMLTLDDGVGRGGRTDLAGLLWRDAGDVELPTGAIVSLLAADSTAHTATVDALGNFVFEGIPFGEYRLEVPLGDDTVIIVEGVRIGP